MRPLEAIGIAWIVWVISWAGAAVWSNPTVKRAASREERIARLIIPVGAILIAVGSTPETSVTGSGGWACFAAVLAGLGFAWWGRLYLGPLWSARVRRAEGHHVVTIGPYAVVRHPIYAGVMTAIVATALVEWRWPAILGAIIIAFSFWLRARVEEKFLRDELGRDTYDIYARRVPMLIPFWPRTG